MVRIVLAVPVSSRTNPIFPIQSTKAVATRSISVLPCQSRVLGVGFCFGGCSPLCFHVPSRERLARRFDVGEEVWVGRTKWQEGWKNFLVVRTNAINIANMDLE